MIDGEDVDKSQWLPDGAEVVNPYRAQHGQITRQGETIGARHAHILDWMLDAGIIDQEQHDAGIEMIRLREYAFAHQDTTMFRGRGASLAGHNFCATTRYNRIMRRLAPADRKLVSVICWGSAMTRATAGGAAGRISTALAALSQILDETQVPL